MCNPDADLVALTRGLPLATFDTKLKRAAKEAGVNLYLQDLLD
jgi:rRNA-processing protein FCF1